MELATVLLTNWEALGEDLIVVLLTVVGCFMFWAFVALLYEHYKEWYNEASRPSHDERRKQRRGREEAILGQYEEETLPKEKSLVEILLYRD